jgi:hypothetical protein
MKIKSQHLLTSLLALFVTTSAVAAPAAGRINNVAWAFASGKAEIVGNDVKITLWNQVFENPCNEWRGSMFDVRAIFPAQVGRWNINPNSFSKNIIIMGDNRVLGSPNNNIVANVGFMNITHMDTVQVTATMSAAYAAKNSRVVGDFTVPLCNGTHE